MKNFLFLLIIIIAFAGCNKKEYEIKGDTVKLIENDDPVIFKKSVILFDNNNYLVKTPLDTFILGFPFITSSEYNDMKARAIADGGIKDILQVSDYLIYSSDSIFTLAYYLETGKCFFYDKLSKESVKTVIVESFQSSDPMSSGGGRRFYINNQLFLEIIDFMGFKKSAYKDETKD
jgi:hypothetical protein